MKIVIMGVAGAGKSTLGEALARELGTAFLDADDLHSAENVAWMTSGRPLTDEMRWPWLDACGAAMNEHHAVVLGCSALKRAYRDRLRATVPDLRLVYPHATKALIEKRVAERKGHFMPTQLIDSQFSTLEEPALDENPVIVPATLPVADAVKLASSMLRAK